MYPISHRRVPYYYTLPSRSSRSLNSTILDKSGSPCSAPPFCSFSFNSLSRTSRAIAASVLGFSRSSFFSISRFRSQFARFGWREKRSTSAPSLFVLSASWIASMAKLIATSSTVSKSSGSFANGFSVYPSLVVLVVAS